MTVITEGVSIRVFLLDLLLRFWGYTDTKKESTDVH